MVAQLTGASCNYTLGATLGVGEYGKAIQCTRDEDGTQVVVKQVGRDRKALTIQYVLSARQLTAPYLYFPASPQ